MPKKNILKLIPMKAYSSSRCSAAFFSTFSTKKYSPELKFSSNFSPEDTIVVPISLTRLNTNERKKAEEYHEHIRLMLTKTAKLLRDGSVKSIYILSTAGLQAINWGRPKSDEIQDIFYKTHKLLLNQQSGFLTWDEYKKLKGEEQFNDLVKEIEEMSKPGSEWSYLINQAHEVCQSGGSLEQSRKYQIEEYAGIVSARKPHVNPDYIFSHMLYLGKPSPAWAYLYKIFSHDELPIFTRAYFEKPSTVVLNSTDSSFASDMISQMLEKALISPNISPKEKKSLTEQVQNLLYMYGSKNEGPPKKKRLAIA